MYRHFSCSVMLFRRWHITVIPALSRRLLGGNTGTGWVLPLPGIDHFARLFVRLTTGFARAAVRSKLLSLVVVIVRVRSVGVLHHPVHPQDGLSAGGESELGLWDHAAAARLQPRHDDGHCQIG